MIGKRYTIVLENQATGVVRRFTVRPRPVLVVLALLLSMPVLFGLGVRWSTYVELQMLRDTARTYEIENASFRAAEAELTGQITALQDSVTDLSKRAPVDPAVAKALSKLPSMVRNRAMGGVADSQAVRSAISPAMVGSEDTFGVLRDLLGRLETRLHFMRTDIDNRSALISATPSIWPAHGWLSATFGEREDPFTGGTEFHTGLDISTDAGRPVYATAAGTVESAFYNGAYGNQISIAHGFGMQTRYAHLSGFAVKPGDKVAQGDVIGYVGATGRATGAHLHYEVLVNGQLINPLPLIVQPANR